MNAFINRVFNILVEILPSDWGKVVLHAAISEGEQTIYFFVQGAGQDKFVSYYDLQKMGIFSKNEFKAVRLAVGYESEVFQKTFEKQWTGYTMVITRDGKVNLDYEYGTQTLDISEDWKRKYL